MATSLLIDTSDKNIDSTRDVSGNVAANSDLFACMYPLATLKPKSFPPVI